MLTKILSTIGVIGGILFIVIISIVLLPNKPSKDMIARGVIASIKSLAFNIYIFQDKNNVIPETLNEALVDEQTKQRVLSSKIEYRKLNDGNALFEICADYPLSQSALVPKNDIASSWTLLNNRLCMKGLH